MKWTAFDQETAAALAAQLPNVAHAPSGDALDSALDHTSDPAANSAVAVLTPARDAGHTLLITMKTRAAAERAAASETSSPEPISYEAGGFLGLSDDPVYEDSKKKK